jgi:hypothetical protein
LRADARAGAPVGHVVETTTTTLDVGTTTTTLGPGETTTSTLGGTPATTTTTLPDGCIVGPSYAGLACRLDALLSLVAQSDLKTGKRLTKLVTSARSALAKAEAAAGGPARRQAKALRKATRALTVFGKLLAASKIAKKIPAPTRAALVAPVDGLLADLAGLTTP